MTLDFSVKMQGSNIGNDLNEAFDTLKDQTLPFDERKQKVKTVLQKIDDKTILRDSKISFSLRMYLLSIKNDRPLDSLVSINQKGEMFYGEIHLGRFAKTPPIYISGIDFKNNSLIINGFIEKPTYTEKFVLYAKNNDKEYIAQFQDEYTQIRKFVAGDTYYSLRKFTVEVPINRDGETVQLHARYDQYTCMLKNYIYNDNQDYPYDLYKLQSSFLSRGNKMITLVRENAIYIKDINFVRKLKYCLKLIREHRILIVKKGSVSSKLNSLLSHKGINFDELIIDNGYVASCLQNGKIIGYRRGRTYINIYKNKEHLLEVAIIVIPTIGKAHPLFVTRKNGVGKRIDFAPKGLVKKEAGTPNWNPDKDIFLCSKAAEAYDKMCVDALKDNIHLIVTHGYRSVALQKELLDELIKRKGERAAKRQGAPPGFSEHHTGLAMDIGGFPGVTSDIDAYKWIADNCWKYGFMIKNLKGKEHITGTKYEPWHIRYIGDIRITKLLHDNYWTLDEYLDSI